MRRQPHVAHFTVANGCAVDLHHGGDVFAGAGNPHFICAVDLVHADVALLNRNAAIAAQNIEQNMPRDSREFCIVEGGGNDRTIFDDKGVTGACFGELVVGIKQCVSS